MKHDTITGRIALIVHGGAGEMPDEDVAACRTGCQEAVQAGWKILQAGGAALDAVEAAIHVLENVPVFDAGRGSYPNADGEIEMDAILMDGVTLNSGAIAAIQRVRHPISVARLVLEQTNHALLVGKGAQAFARKMGVPECALADLQRPEAQAQNASGSTGTVGAIARDAQGNLVVGTSTGGTKQKTPGRVGDSPLIGCGAYADTALGAASATGMGEDLMKIVMSKAACDLMGTGVAAQTAAEQMIRSLEQRVHGKGGLITMTPQGDVGYAFNTQRMTCGWVSTDGRIEADCFDGVPG